MNGVKRMGCRAQVNSRRRVRVRDLNGNFDGRQGRVVKFVKYVKFSC
jgi:hypothetical protein